MLRRFARAFRYIPARITVSWPNVLTHCYSDRPSHFARHVECRCNCGKRPMFLGKIKPSFARLCRTGEPMIHVDNLRRETQSPATAPSHAHFFWGAGGCVWLSGASWDRANLLLQATELAPQRIPRVFFVCWLTPRLGRAGYMRMMSLLNTHPGYDGPRLPTTSMPFPVLLCGGL